jgi:hypothetical protein
VRQQPRWLHLRDNLRRFGVEDAAPTDCPLSDEDSDSEGDSDDVGHIRGQQQDNSDGVDSGHDDNRADDATQAVCRYRPVRWRQLKPPRKKLDVAEWTEQSQSVVPKKKKSLVGKSGSAANGREGTSGSGAGTTLFHFNYDSVEKSFCHGPSNDPARALSAQQISDVLCGQTKPEHLVGIGEIVDPSHPVRKAATEHGYTDPVYLVFAKKDLPYGTVLGEYTGRVVTECAGFEEDAKQLDMEKPETGTLTSKAIKGEVFSKYTYKTTERASWSEELVIDTGFGANELVYMNDFREVSR